MSEISKLIAEIKSEGILRAGNKLEQLYTLAEQKEKHYAALKQKLDAMVDEVNGIREQAEDVYAAGYRHGHLNTVDGCAYATPVEDEFYHNALQVMLEVETPATDAYMNSVRAEGLKMAIDHMNNQTSDDCADVTVLPVIEMYKKLISGTHDTASEAG